MGKCCRTLSRCTECTHNFLTDKSQDTKALQPAFLLRLLQNHFCKEGSGVSGPILGITLGTMNCKDFCADLNASLKDQGIPDG